MTQNRNQIEKLKEQLINRIPLFDKAWEILGEREPVEYEENRDQLLKELKEEGEGKLTELHPYFYVRPVVRHRRGLTLEQVDPIEALEEFRKGGKSLLCITGPSGCGKSTLLAEMAIYLAKKDVNVYYISARTIVLEEAKKEIEETLEKGGVLILDGLDDAPIEDKATLLLELQRKTEKGDGKLIYSVRVEVEQAVKKNLELSEDKLEIIPERTAFKLLKKYLEPLGLEERAEELYKESPEFYKLPITIKLLQQNLLVLSSEGKIEEELLKQVQPVHLYTQLWNHYLIILGQQAGGPLDRISCLMAFRKVWEGETQIGAETIKQAVEQVNKSIGSQMEVEEVKNSLLKTPLFTSQTGSSQIGQMEVHRSALEFFAARHLTLLEKREAKDETGKIIRVINEGGVHLTGVLDALIQFLQTEAENQNWIGEKIAELEEAVLGRSLKQVEKLTPAIKSLIKKTSKQTQLETAKRAAQKTPEEALEIAKQGVGDADADVRLAAQRVAGVAAEKLPGEALEIAKQGITDKDEKVWLAALGVTTIVAEKLPGEAIEVAKQWIRSEDVRVRLAALLIARVAAEKLPGEALEVAKQGVGDADARVRLAAQWIAKDVAEKLPREALKIAKQGVTDKDEKVRIEAQRVAFFVAKKLPEEALKIAKQGVTDKDGEVRMEALGVAIIVGVTAKKTPRNVLEIIKQWLKNQMQEGDMFSSMQRMMQSIAEKFSMPPEILKQLGSSEYGNVTKISPRMIPILVGNVLRISPTKFLEMFEQVIKSKDGGMRRIIRKGNQNTEKQLEEIRVMFLPILEQFMFSKNEEDRRKMRQLMEMIPFGALLKPLESIFKIIKKNNYLPKAPTEDKGAISDKLTKQFLETVKQWIRGEEKNIQRVMLLAVRASVIEQSNEILKELLKIAKQGVTDKDEKVRIDALECTLIAAEKLPKEALEIAKQGITDKDEKVRIEAQRVAFAAAEELPEEALKISKQGARDADADVRLAAQQVAFAAAEKLPREALEVAKQGITDKDEKVRIEALEDVKRVARVSVGVVLGWLCDLINQTENDCIFRIIESVIEAGAKGDVDEKYLVHLFSFLVSKDRVDLVSGLGLVVDPLLAERAGRRTVEELTNKLRSTLVSSGLEFDIASTPDSIDEFVNIFKKVVGKIEDALGSAELEKTKKIENLLRELGPFCGLIVTRAALSRAERRGRALEIAGDSLNLLGCNAVGDLSMRLKRLRELVSRGVGLEQRHNLLEKLSELEKLLEGEKELKVVRKLTELL